MYDYEARLVGKQKYITFILPNRHKHFLLFDNEIVLLLSYKHCRFVAQRIKIKT